MDRKAHASLDEWESLVARLDPIVEELGHFPSSFELSKLSRPLKDAISAFPGGMVAVRKCYGVASPHKPSGYWLDVGNVFFELQPLVDSQDSFPTAVEVRQFNPSLYKAIYDYHGGLVTIREQMGYTSGKKPNGFWKDWAHVEPAMHNIISLLGRFPKGKEIPSGLRTCLYRHHGGYHAVKVRMGYGDELAALEELVASLAE